MEYAPLRLQVNFLDKNLSHKSLEHKKPEVLTTMKKGTPLSHPQQPHTALPCGLSCQEPTPGGSEIMSFTPLLSFFLSPT